MSRRHLDDTRPEPCARALSTPTYGPTARLALFDQPKSPADSIMHPVSSLRGQVQMVPRIIRANMVTPAGLKIGDTLAQARRIYGADFRISLAQGGSWFVATSTGTLDGLLTDEVNESHATPRIADIDAGSVGCPATSP